MPATRQDLFDRFAGLGIETTTREHAPVHTVEEAQRVCHGIPGGHCKNLFLKDDKSALWLIVCLHEARIDLKSAPALIGSRRLTFGKPQLLMQSLGVEPGSVTPFGLINDTGARVNVVLEAAMMRHDILNFHPLSNDASTSIKPVDLLAFIRSCGQSPRIVALDAGAVVN